MKRTIWQEIERTRRLSRRDSAVVWLAGRVLRLASRDVQDRVRDAIWDGIRVQREIDEEWEAVP